MANSVYNRRAWEEFAPPEDENEEEILDAGLRNAQVVSGMNISESEPEEVDLKAMLGTINSSRAIKAIQLVSTE